MGVGGGVNPEFAEASLILTPVDFQSCLQQWATSPPASLPTKKPPTSSPKTFDLRFSWFPSSTPGSLQLQMCCHGDIGAQSTSHRGSRPTSQPWQVTAHSIPSPAFCSGQDTVGRADAARKTT